MATEFTFSLPCSHSAADSKTSEISTYLCPDGRSMHVPAHHLLGQKFALLAPAQGSVCLRWASACTFALWALLLADSGT